MALPDSNLPSAIGVVSFGIATGFSFTNGTELYVLFQLFTSFATGSSCFLVSGW